MENFHYHYKINNKFNNNLKTISKKHLKLMLKHCPNLQTAHKTIKI